ncbi:MAG: hypothetical protein AB1346_00040 [Thermodesulfobacteriota bacterium]
MNRFLAALAAALLIAGASADSHALEIGARGAYWFPEISGAVRTITAGIVETDIDLKNTLGVQDENLPFGELFFSFGNSTLRVGFTKLDFTGSRVLNQNITFNGQNFAVAEAVTTDIDISMIDASWQYDILRPSVGVGSVNLGLLLQVKYVDGDVRLTGSATGTAAETFQAPIPMVGAAFGVGLVKNLLRADIRGAGIGFSGNHLVDVEAYASITPFPFVKLQGGYRYLGLQIDEAEILASLRLKGPYAGVQISF